jgi:large subunit ribosomal protein L31e
MAEKTIEKVYTVPLRSGWVKEPRSKRSNRAMRDLKAFVLKHAKTKDVKISKGINELIFARGFQKPPSRIKVEVSGDKEIAQIKLPGEVIEDKTEKKGGIAGLKDRLTGRGEDKKGKDSKKALKERVEKELTQEKVNALVGKAVKEEKAKKTKPVKEPETAETTEELLEEAEEAVKEEGA